MLSHSAYIYAITFYLSSGLVCLSIIFLLCRRYITKNLRLPFFLILLVIILTPAYPREGVDTMAPALVVLAFRAATLGLDSAHHAIRPLLYGVSFVILSSILIASMRLIFKLLRK